MTVSHPYSLRALLGIGVVALFWLGLYAITTGRVSSRGSPSPAAPSDQPLPGRGFTSTPEALTAAASLKRTTLVDLPGLPQQQGMPRLWDLVDGLNAIAIEVPSPLAGQTSLRLTALASQERHAISARFMDLSPETLYRVTVWLKARPAQRVMIEARDSVVLNTGKAANYGIAHFDIGAGAVMRASGDLRAQGVERPKTGWLALWCDLHTKDGQIYVLLGFLQSPNNQHIFVGAGEQLILGGFEITRR